MYKKRATYGRVFGALEDGKQSSHVTIYLISSIIAAGQLRLKSLFVQSERARSGAKALRTLVSTCFRIQIANLKTKKQHSSKSRMQMKQLLLLKSIQPVTTPLILPIRQRA